MLIYTLFKFFHTQDFVSHNITAAVFFPVLLNKSAKKHKS